MRSLSASSSLLTLAAIAALMIHTPAIGADTAAASAAPAANVTREAAPAWITPRDLPQATPAQMQQVREGIAYLLSDLQTRIRPDGHDEWFRVATQVVERTGLETAGQISISFDPHFESVAFHAIRIIRAGKVIDLTNETQFRVVEREDSLDEGIVSGTLKAVANLRDVRVGDIIDYAYTTHTRSSLWPGHFFGHFSQRYSDPLAYRAVRYVWPAGMAGQYKALNSTVSFATRKIGDGIEWEWTDRAPPAQQGEDDVPANAYQWGTVDISTMRSWRDLAQWGAHLYTGDSGLPADFTARLDAIARAHPAKAEQVSEVTRYLQDAIRYVGEEMGEGSYVPRRPALVLQRGYGDCKDKSLLLATALRYLGIEATPALVSTTRGPTLPDRLPSARLFDHVIVRVAVDGHVLWLDPTGSYRGGRGLTMVPADFGYALPLAMGQGGLEKMEGYAAHAGRMAVREHFDVDEKGQVPLSLHVETTYTDARADAMRAHVADVSIPKISKENLDFYRKRFAGLVESQPVTITDDREANRLVMTENYTLPRADFDKDKIADKLITRAYAIADLLPEKQSGPRQQPLALPRYVSREQVIELQVKGRRLWQPTPIDSKAQGIAFTRQSTQDGEFNRITYRLTTGEALSAPAGDSEAVYAISETIKDEGGLEFYLTKSAKPRDSDDPALDPAVMAIIGPDLLKVTELAQKGNDASAIEALSLLSAASAKVKHPSPEAGLIDGVKGLLLAQLRRNVPALAALQSATAQYQGNADVFRLWVAYEIDNGDPAAILKALRRTLQAQPAVLTRLDDNWVMMIRQKLRKLPPAERDKAGQDLCIVLTDGGWGLDPRTAGGAYNLSCAIAAHSRRGELDEARKELDLKPDASALTLLALDQRHRALWPDIDRLGADGYHQVLEQDLAHAAAAVKAAPGNTKALTMQMRALRRLGRYGEAITLGKPLATDRARIEVIGDDAFWLINDYAAALLYTGRVDEAVAALDGALSLGLDAYPVLGGIAINRAGLLNEAGRHAAALAAMEDLEGKAATHLTPAGRMFMWSEKSCALHALGRGEEARAVEAKMAEKPEDNWAAMTRVAVCRKDVEGVARLLVTRLRDEEERTGALPLFLRYKSTERDKTAATLPFAASMRATMQAAMATPAVQAEFRQVGRVVTYAGTTAGWPEY